MKFITSLFLMCFLTISVFAQNGGSARLIGTVKDTEGNPVSGAKVTIVRKGETKPIRVVTTDDEGNYEFLGDSGDWIISVSKNINGKIFKSEIQEITLVTDIERKLDFRIKDIAFIKDDVPPQTPGLTLTKEYVTVSVATGTTQPISEISKTVNIIGDEEITNRNEITLADTLRTIPGFRVQQLGGFGRTANIKTRGLRNQDTAILIDGIRFRDPASITGDASAFLSDFSTANVGRVEVLRGSGSSIYGTNAIGGVVDFQTPIPKKDLNGSFVAEYGGLGMTRFRGDVGAGTPDGKLAFTSGFSNTRFTEGIDGEDDADNTNLQGRVEYKPLEKTNISGRLYFSDAFVRLNSNPDTLGVLPSGIIDAREGVNFVADANEPDIFQKSNFFSGQIALTQIINSKAIFSANYQGLKTKRKNFSVFDGQIHTANAKFDYIPITNNRLTFGYEYENEKFGNNADGSNQFSTSARQKSNTLFVQNLLGLINNKLQLAGGFRFQNFSLDTPQFSTTSPIRGRLVDPKSPPNAYTFDGAASYYFTDSNTKLRFHIGNGYRNASLYERFGSFFFLGAFLTIGNPQLDPERSIGLDGGIEQGFYDNRLRLSASYFYTRVRNEIAYLPTDDLGGNGYFNNDKTFSRGFETSAEIRPSNRTKIFGSYTFVNSDERNSRRITQLPPATIVSFDRKSFGVPDHQFTFVATQNIGKNLTVNFDFLATSDYLAPIFSSSDISTFTYRFKGNRRGDLTGRYTIPAFKEKVNFVLFGTVENIFDNEYFENGFRTAGINGRFGLGLNF